MTRTLGAAVATLNMGSSTEAEKTAALRVLRFLDTPASVHELVFRLGTRGDRSGWNEISGLAGSRYQNLVVQELERQVHGSRHKRSRKIQRQTAPNGGPA